MDGRDLVEEDSYLDILAIFIRNIWQLYTKVNGYIN